MTDVRARLTDAELPSLVERLGFRGPDVADVLAAAAAVTAAPALLARVERLADAVRGRIAAVPTRVEGPSPFGSPDADHADPANPADGLGLGVLPLLALVATAADVNAHHLRRGIDDDTSWRSLSDLGQQVWVHRQTYGEFGLHTQDWLLVAWSGSLFWLGRLQFELALDGAPASDAGVAPDTADTADAADTADTGAPAAPAPPARFALATHIPQSGPLPPAAVDEAFDLARAFVTEHYPELAITAFTCHSWLLDPELAAALPGSNIAAFQRRWHLDEEARDGDEDAVFFTFRRRGTVDLDSLPQTTSLERAVVARLRTGDHWTLRSGRVAF